MVTEKEIREKFKEACKSLNGKIVENTDFPEFCGCTIKKDSEVKATVGLNTKEKIISVAAEFEDDFQDVEEIDFKKTGYIGVGPIKERASFMRTEGAMFVKTKTESFIIDKDGKIEALLK